MPILAWDDDSWNWDDDHVWDGESTPTTHMPNDNRISAVMTEVTKDLILTKLGEIRALMPFLLNLTPEERQELPKLGDKTMAFDHKCKTGMEQNPMLVPGYVVPAEVQKDRDLREPVVEVEAAMKALCDSVSDTGLLLGTEILMADLSFYQNVRQAAKRGVAGAQALYDELRERFPGGGGTPPPAPPAPPTP